MFRGAVEVWREIGELKRGVEEIEEIVERVCGDCKSTWEMRDRQMRPPEVILASVRSARSTPAPVPVVPVAPAVVSSTPDPAPDMAQVEGVLARSRVLLETGRDPGSGRSSGLQLPEIAQRSRGKNVGDAPPKSSSAKPVKPQWGARAPPVKSKTQAAPSKPPSKGTDRRGTDQLSKAYAPVKVVPSSSSTRGHPAAHKKPFVNPKVEPVLGVVRPPPAASASAAAAPPVPAVTAPAAPNSAVRSAIPSPRAFDSLPSHLRAFLNSRQTSDSSLLEPAQAASRFLSGLPSPVPRPAPPYSSSGSARAYMSRVVAALESAVEPHDRESPCCSWLGSWLPGREICGLLVPPNLCRDDLGRTVLRYETQRALRRLYRHRCRLQTSLAMLRLESVMADRLLPQISTWSDSLDRGAPPPTEFLSAFRTTHSLLCCQCREPCRIFLQPSCPVCNIPDDADASVQNPERAS